MKPKLHLTDFAILAITAMPFIYLSTIYNQLPNQVATHFGSDGKADSIGNKSSLWLGISITGGMGIFTYCLLRLLPRIDPKKTAKYSAGVFNKIAVAVALLLVCINFLIINAAQTLSLIHI